MKKLSIDTTGALVADVDFTRLVKYTTFTLRWVPVERVRSRTLKNYNEFGMKKVAVGTKVMTGNVAFDASFDCMGNKYNSGLVYAVCLVYRSEA